MITREKLNEIIESHGKWLRDEKGGKRADLRDADLRGADLRGADLRGAVLRDADLSYAVYQVSRIGCRKGTTTYNATLDNVQCGCWGNYRGGTLAEFIARIESVYGENGSSPNKQYYNEYMAAIDFFIQMKKLGDKDD